MRESRSRRVEAIVLKHLDWGEADRLLVLFSREMGKIRAVAKGARKMRSRKAGHLEPFTRVVLQLAKGRDLWIVTQAEMQEAYQGLREDLVRTAYASYVVELLDRFTYEEGENTAIYRLLCETLQRVAQDQDVFLAVRYYEIRILDLLGFRPDLFHCVECQREIQAEDQFFSALQGGVICLRCGFKQGSVKISMQALRYFRHLQRSSFRDAKRAHIDEKVQGEMESVMHFYLTYLLERDLNSPSFLREVRHEE
jgi:DNA repair protein RecO (recombination protein O)